MKSARICLLLLVWMGLAAGCGSLAWIDITAPDVEATENFTENVTENQDQATTDAQNAPLVTTPVTQSGNLAGASTLQSTNQNTPPGQTDEMNRAAVVDAEGFDTAERRVMDVYDRVAPSVVSITTEVLRRNFFFEVVPEEGSGSGFVIDRQGHILTNYHVIRNAQRISVDFEDDISLAAQVIGVDPRNDIAVLQVDAPEELLVPVEFGSSANLIVGQRAIAIGNPFGQFGRTLTTGVISSVGRTLEGPDGRAITGVIQTDAAINRGNSGGPLLDSSGRVIGINTAIFSPTGASAGVGFAIPVDTVKRLLPDLLTLGRYRHPWFGIRYAYALSPRLAEELDLPVDHGLLIVQLYDGSPLLPLGIRGAQREVVIANQRIFVGGDILLAVDEIPVSRLDALEVLLEDNYRVGDTVTLRFLRDGEEFTLEMELQEEPPS